MLQPEFSSARSKREKGVYQTRLSLLSVRDTERFASMLAGHVGAGDKVMLIGEIGAGKTVLAKSLIRAASLPTVIGEDIPSPTYTLVQTYAGARFEIWHADLYRLHSCWEVVELGLLDAFDKALCIVEWGDRMTQLAPDDALWLKLDNPTESPDFRFLTITSTKRGLIDLIWKTW